MSPLYTQIRKLLLPLLALSLLLPLVEEPLFAGTPREVAKGVVIDAQTGEPLPMAVLRILGSDRGTVCDLDGQFSLTLPKHSDVTRVRITCMGYLEKVVTIEHKSTARLVVRLHPSTIALDEFTVTARYNTQEQGSTTTITREAIEYIQPTSLQDLFVMLPGGLVPDNNIFSRKLIPMRQVGTEPVSSFGIGVIIDGVPLTNDAERMQIAGLTGINGIDKYTNTTINAGVDLRNISTDHIDRVEVTRGISSAREGNLSSGSIRIFPKRGKGPLVARLKHDPLNRLAYVGKGFRVPYLGGTLHAGIDLTDSKPGSMDVRQSYKRLTGQATYDNQWRLRGGDRLSFSLRGSYTGSFDNEKEDDITRILKEYYRTTYSNVSLSTKLQYRPLASPLLDLAELRLSLTDQRRLLYHRKTVVIGSPRPIQTSNEEGEHEGLYLPSVYTTTYQIDNRPLTFYGLLSGNKTWEPAKWISLSGEAGVEIDVSKNYGPGSVSDRERPPFPTNKYIRPRPNYLIPALVHYSPYLEERIRLRHGAWMSFLSLGLRGTQMLNLPSDYALSRLFLLEPRLQGSVTYKAPVEITLRGGYGMHRKLPSADFLYPDREYYDLMSLNAYFNEPEKRFLILDTRIFDPTNRELRENINAKAELGIDLHHPATGGTLSLSLFRETMRNGVQYHSIYTPAEYTYYYKLKHPVDTKPTREDFYSDRLRTFILHRAPRNSSYIEKEGIEYRLYFPKIRPLASTLEINGAYYRSMYTNGLPIMNYPDIMQDGRGYPYVGLFDGFYRQYTERLNTNIWLHTHLPQLRLLFSNFIQIIWYESSQLGRDVDAYPSAYMDHSGSIHPLTPDDVDGDPTLKLMKRSFIEATYDKEVRPISLLMNFKLSYEASQRTKLSFFANNIIDINPQYQTKYKKTTRRMVAPFFGLELVVKL